jgi:hypothetical protein
LFLAGRQDSSANSLLNAQLINQQSINNQSAIDVIDRVTFDQIRDREKNGEIAIAHHLGKLSQNRGFAAAPMPRKDELIVWLGAVFHELLQFRQAAIVVAHPNGFPILIGHQGLELPILEGFLKGYRTVSTG